MTMTHADKAGASTSVQSANDARLIPDHLDLRGGFELVPCKEERRADSRLLALHFGIQHKNLIEQINAYKADFEATGKLAFKTEASESGQTVRFVLLNEDQCFLALSFSKNTKRVRALKVKMVQAFGEARRAADMRKAEYLPGYHAAHDVIHALADGSENERFHHINFNKMLNKVCGIVAGQRGGAALPTQALMIVAQLAATQAMQGAADHKDAYHRAKQALEPLAALTQAPAQAATPYRAGTLKRERQAQAVQIAVIGATA